MMRPLVWSPEWMGEAIKGVAVCGMQSGDVGFWRLRWILLLVAECVGRASTSV